MVLQFMKPDYILSMSKRETAGSRLPNNKQIKMTVISDLSVQIIIEKILIK